MELTSDILDHKLDETVEGVDLKELIFEMFSYMYKNKGIGLAANQIGDLNRVFVMHAGKVRQEFINPIITKRYGGKVKSLEGCLSFPNQKVTVMRDKQIIISGFNQYWKPVKLKLKGVSAICAQHELDHLNGTTII